MRIIFLVLILGLFTNFQLSAQIETGNFYTVLKVKYGLKKEGIVYDMAIDIGTDTKHPLYGIVSNANDAILIKDDNSQVVLTNEVDVLSFLRKKGWVISTCAPIHVLSSNYTQYILTEANRQ